MDLNVVSVTGRLTRDVEARYTATAKSVATFGLAINGFKDETTFIEIECWERTAEAARDHLRKGSRVGITGRLKLDQWTDQSGAKRSKVGVVATQIAFLESRTKDDGYEYQRAPDSQRHEDDNPF